MKNKEFLSGITDATLLALLLHGEGRGESPIGILSIAHVVLNRAAKRTWYGATIREVMLKPYQFSCFNDDNFAIHYDEVCMTVAELALGGATVDVTGGATHYHANYVAPAWIDGMTHLVTIGRHLFYKASDE